MATIAEQLASIKSSKEAIKSAIISKGVSCGDVLSDYAASIAAIPTAKTEETQTIDITRNGTFECVPSSEDKVLSKVVVNANVTLGNSYNKLRIIMLHGNEGDDIVNIPINSKRFVTFFSQDSEGYLTFSSTGKIGGVSNDGMTAIVFVYVWAHLDSGAVKMGVKIDDLIKTSTAQGEWDGGIIDCEVSPTDHCVYLTFSPTSGGSFIEWANVEIVF